MDAPDAALAASSAPTGPDQPDDYVALLASVEALLDGVDRALAALDAGAYGTCEACGAALDDADLASDPLATRCPRHAAAAGTAS